jgi:hypothetical protein
MVDVLESSLKTLRDITESGGSGYREIAAEDFALLLADQYGIWVEYGDSAHVSPCIAAAVS